MARFRRRYYREQPATNIILEFIPLGRRGEPRIPRKGTTMTCVATLDQLQNEIRNEKHIKQDILGATATALGETYVVRWPG